MGAGLWLAAGPAAAQPPDLLFQAEAQVLSGTCTGQAVRVEGNHNTLTLSGPCGSLLLKGLANTVRLRVVPGGSIRVEGASNRVLFTAQGAAPAIVALGPDNDVASAGPAPTVVLNGSSPAVPDAPLARPVPARPAPTPSATPDRRPPAPAPVALPSGPLVLNGDDAQRLEDCAGRDVTVTGNRSAYVIRGFCKSLTVRGDLLAVQAELASGARIAITGQGSIVSWAVKPRGHAPAAIVRGQGSRVQRAETIGGQADR